MPNWIPNRIVLLAFSIFFNHHSSNVATDLPVVRRGTIPVSFIGLASAVALADGSRNLLLKVEDQEGNVVLLRPGGVVAGKIGDSVEEGVSETRSRNIALRFQKFFAA